MAETILEKESVVDYWISFNRKNYAQHFLSNYQYVVVNLLNHHYHPKIFISSKEGKDDVCIRIPFKTPEQILVDELESLLNLRAGELSDLLLAAKMSDVKKAEARCLSVKLDMEKEVNVGDEEKVSAMLFYERTELAHTLLRRAINAYSNILHLAEYRKDAEALAMDLDQVKKNRDIAIETLRNTSFNSLDEMSYIIDTYSPIVKELYRA